jgi:hypothetical protein
LDQPIENRRTNAKTLGCAFTLTLILDSRQSGEPLDLQIVLQLFGIFLLSFFDLSACVRDVRVGPKADICPIAVRIAWKTE